MGLVVSISILVVFNYFIFKKNINNKRNSNIEMLRIISMLLIVAHHFTLHGYEITKLEFSYNKLILDFFVLGGKVGVNIFIIVSSFYLIDKKYSFEKLLKLIFSVKFYAIFFLFIGVIVKVRINVIAVLESIFPIIYQLYWFISGYIILYAISPILNISLESLNKEKLKILVVISLIIYSFINVFLGATLFFSSIIWFIILYIITYYIKIYINLNSFNSNKIIVVSLLSYVCIYLSVIIFDILGNRYMVLRQHMLYFAKENSIFTVISAFGFFLYFIKRKRFYSKIINYISSGTLAIYMIHENIFVRPIIYNFLIKNINIVDTKFCIFFYYNIGMVLVTFILCLLFGKIIDCCISNLSYYINFKYFEKKMFSYIQFLINLSKKYEK